MTSTKLIYLLKSLSPDEFKQFGKFVDSAYHNKGRDLSHLLRLLKSFYPEFSHRNLNNEYLFRKLFPEKDYDPLLSENLIRTLTSHLFRICKEFLIVLELESRKSTKQYLLLNQLRKRRLYKEFDKEFDNRHDQGEDISKGSVGYFVNEFLLSAVKRDCSLNRDDFGNSVEYTVRASENILTAALISCYKFEDEKNLAAAYNIVPRENMLQPLLEHLDTDKLLPAIKENNPGYYPYIEIFHSIYLMSKFRENTSYYFSLKELLKKYSAIFGRAENYVLWNILLTYCGVNRMDSKEVFGIHKHILENGIYKLSDKEDFHIVLFRNIVLNASATGEYKWLEQFIEKYSDDLHDNHRGNMRAYSMAYLHFAKAEFEKALESILKIKYNLFLFKLDLKILQLKIYYELGYFEEGLSLVATTLSYLKSTDELAPFIKESVGEYAKCLKDLIRIRTNFKKNKDDLSSLRLRAQKILYPNLTVWLMDKIDAVA